MHECEVSRHPLPFETANFLSRITKTLSQYMSLIAQHYKCSQKFQYSLKYVCFLFMTAISLFLPEYLPIKIQDENDKRNLLPRRHWLIMCTGVILSHSCAHRHTPHWPPRYICVHGGLAKCPRAHHKALQRRGIRVSETFAESWSSGAARPDHREWSVFPWKGMSRSDRGWEIGDSLRPHVRHLCRRKKPSYIGGHWKSPHRGLKNYLGNVH